MGASSLLLAGFAQLIADAIPDATWAPAGDYATSDLAIVIDAVPAGLPDLISLSEYPVADAGTLSDSTSGLQVRTRRAGAHPTPVRDLDDAIFDVLQGYVGTLPSGIRVVSCFRRSGASLGQDDNDRWMRSSNYYAQIHRPSSNRT